MTNPMTAITFKYDSPACTVWLSLIAEATHEKLTIKENQDPKGLVTSGVKLAFTETLRVWNRRTHNSQTKVNLNCHENRFSNPFLAKPSKAKRRKQPNSYPYLALDYKQTMRPL